MLLVFYTFLYVITNFVDACFPGSGELNDGTFSSGQIQWCVENMDVCYSFLCNRYDFDCQSPSMKVQIMNGIRHRASSSWGSNCYYTGCPSSLVCKNGQCVLPPALTSNNFLLSALHTCSRTDECPRYEMCRKNRCWPSNLRGYTCGYRNKCPMPDIYECSYDSVCRIPEEGGSYWRSYVNRYFNGNNHKSSPPVITIVNQPPSLPKSNNYAHISASGSCQSTNQCPKYHMCRRQQCWPSKIKNRHCKRSGDCGSSGLYECVHGECKIPESVG